MILYESLLVPVLTYGHETLIWREKERSRIRAVQMDNIRGLLGIRRMEKCQIHGKGSCAQRRKGWMKGLMKVFSDGSSCGENGERQDC